MVTFRCACDAELTLPMAWRRFVCAVCRRLYEWTQSEPGAKRQWMQRAR